MEETWGKGASLKGGIHSFKRVLFEAEFAHNSRLDSHLEGREPENMVHVNKLSPQHGESETRCPNTVPEKSNRYHNKV